MPNPSLRLSWLALYLAACAEPVAPGGPPPVPDAGPVPQAVSCAAGLTACGEACVDLRTDAAHCGDCALQCPIGVSCAAGACYPDTCPDAACARDQLCVDGACSDRACVGVVCPDGSACSRGVCEPCVDGRCIEPECVGVVCPASTPCHQGRCVATCTEGASCQTGSACYDGVVECGSGRPVCQHVAAPPGRGCGAGQVCDGDGGCTACAAGAACVPTNPCMLGTLACATGSALCVQGAPAAAGSACGAGRVCDGRGACVGCAAGAACDAGACVFGALKCSSGAPLCTIAGSWDAGVFVAPGVVCAGDAGVNRCDAGSACTGNPGQCRDGVLSCASGAGQCIDGAARPPGTACSGGRACDGNGSCGCTPNVVCFSNPNPVCFRGITSCATGVQQCLDGPPRTGATCAANDVTTGTCVQDGGVCSTAGTRTVTTTPRSCSGTGQCLAGTPIVTTEACTFTPVRSPCTGNPDPCLRGLSSCATGALRCLDDPFTAQPAGSSCGTTHTVGACTPAPGQCPTTGSYAYTQTANACDGAGQCVAGSPMISTLSCARVPYGDTCTSGTCDASGTCRLCDGDGVCDNLETELSCPRDCGVVTAPGSVQGTPLPGGSMVTQLDPIYSGHTELVVVGVYGAGNVANERRSIDVAVTRPAPMILVLSSYEPIDWNLTLGQGTQVQQIILSGNYLQAVSGAGQIPVVNRSPSSFGWFGCGFRWPFTGSVGDCDTRVMLSAIEAFTQLPVAHFAGAYSATAFTVQ